MPSPQQPRHALAGRGQIDEAIAHYRKALEIKPDYAEAHNNLGAGSGGRGQIDEAIAHYQQALEIKPVVWQSTPQDQSIPVRWHSFSGSLFMADFVPIDLMELHAKCTDAPKPFDRRRTSFNFLGWRHTILHLFSRLHTSSVMPQW